MTGDDPLVTLDEASGSLGALPGPVAVTGGTGFVGSHLVDTLCAAGIRPRVLVRDPHSPRWIAGREVEWVQGSLDDPGALGRLVDGAGTVLHLAGLVRTRHVAAFDEANRRGTERLAAAVLAVAPEARMVYVSSLAAVGPAPGPEGVGPDDEPHPVSAYGRSKLGGEDAVRAMGAGRRWCVVRPPAIYGPRDTDVLEFFRMAARGLMLRPAGERWLTVAWVGDVVRGILAAACHGDEGACYHLGEPRPHRLDELMRTIATAGGVRARIVPVVPVLVRAVAAAGGLATRLGAPSPLTPDKARELLASHWVARTAGSLEALRLCTPLAFAEGARTTWSWYRARRWVG